MRTHKGAVAFGAHTMFPEQVDEVRPAAQKVWVVVQVGSGRGPPSGAVVTQVLDTVVCGLKRTDRGVPAAGLGCPQLAAVTLLSATLLLTDEIGAPLQVPFEKKSAVKLQVVDT